MDKMKTLKKENNAIHVPYLTLFTSFGTILRVFAYRGSCRIVVVRNMAHARRLLRPLLGLRPLLCPRPRVRTYIDDVYKTLGYAAPFTKEESESVVGHINAASDFDALIDIGLSKKMSVMLVKHREKHFGRKDTIECVEQLLDINDVRANKSGMGMERVGLKLEIVSFHFRSQRNNLFAVSDRFSSELVPRTSKNRPRP
jgi:hypothetical protein